MLSHKIVNILVMLFLIISPLFAGGSQVLSQAAQASGGQPVLKGPYPNDTIGGTNSGTGQMRTTTRAMREAAAYQQKQQRGVSQNYAGIDKYNGLTSPLEFNPNASLSPQAMTPLAIPDYFGVANWANSQLPQIDATGAVIAGTGIQKFVDALPGICGVGTTNLLGQCIPLAVADTTTFPGSDYYEIGLVQYAEKMHSNLAPTLLRGYVQIDPTGTGVALTNTLLNGTTVPVTLDGTPTGAQVFGKTIPHYLGPLVLTTRDRPVRVKFTNFLPTGAGGNLFIPVDTTDMGAGMGPNGTDELYTQNRATLHLHGGATPWISDGTPHQWITPAGEVTPFVKGASQQNVPDMPLPSSGSATFYWPNQQGGGTFQVFLDDIYGRFGDYTQVIGQQQPGGLGQLTGLTPDVVLAIETGADAARLLQQWANFGLKGKIQLVTSQNTTDQSIIRNLSAAEVEGIISCSHFAEGRDDPSTKTFPARPCEYRSAAWSRRPRNTGEGTPSYWAAPCHHDASH